jgi:hypothetical protein
MTTPPNMQWSKQVTVDPPVNISFSQAGMMDERPMAWITITNRSNDMVLFKVKTTKPTNYLVRPSLGFIKAQSPMKVQVILNMPLESAVSIFTPKF